MFAELKARTYAAKRTLQVEEADKNRFVLLISTCLPSIGVTFITLMASIITQVVTYEILGVQTPFFIERTILRKSFVA